MYTCNIIYFKFDFTENHLDVFGRDVFDGFGYSVEAKTTSTEFFPSEKCTTANTQCSKARFRTNIPLC